MEKLKPITPHRTAQALAVILVGVLTGIAIPLLLQGVGTEIAVVALFVFIGSQGLMWHAFLSATRSKFRLDVFSPLVYFPILYSVFYGIGAIVYSRRQGVTLPGYEYTWYFAGLLTYFVGVLTAMWLPWPRRKGRDWNIKRVRQAILGLFALGAVSFAYIILRSGVPIFSRDVEAVRTFVIEQVGGYLINMASVLQIVVILLFVYAFVYLKARLPLKYPVWVVLLIAALLLLATQGARRRLAEPLLTAIIAYHYFHKRLSVTNLIILGSGAFLLFILAGALRSQGRIQLDPAMINRVLYNEAVRGASAMNTLVEAIPARAPFFGWAGVLLPFAALAPGRQKLLDTVLKEDILEKSFRGGGWVPTLLGWFYANFGSAGIYVGMLLMGLLIGLLYQRMLRKNDVFSTTLYSYVATYYLSALRGGIFTLWPLYVVVALYLVDVYCRAKLRPAERLSAVA